MLSAAVLGLSVTQVADEVQLFYFDAPLC